jgi:hypothetical protein
VDGDGRADKATTPKTPHDSHNSNLTPAPMARQAIFPRTFRAPQQKHWPFFATIVLAIFNG